MKKQNVWKSLTRNWGLWEVVDKTLLQEFHMVALRTSELWWSVHTCSSAWERGAHGGLTLGRKWEHALSLSPLFTAVGFVFQSLQTSTFLGVIWNKEFRQSKSKKGLYLSVSSTRLESILCWGRVAVLCLKCWNWHLKILKLDYAE